MLLEAIKNDTLKEALSLNNKGNNISVSELHNLYTLLYKSN